MQMLGGKRDDAGQQQQRQQSGQQPGQQPQRQQQQQSKNNKARKEAMSLRLTSMIQFHSDDKTNPRRSGGFY